jgi:hypothetical protein
MTLSDDPTISCLERQVECYRRLAKLAALQHEHVQQGQTDALLDVLASRQVVLEEIAQIEREIAPAKHDWAAYLASMKGEARSRAEALLAETRALLEQITTADRNDVLVLQQRKLNLGRQIQQASVAKQINRNYGAAAYGGAPNRSRMDVQR